MAVHTGPDEKVWRGLLGSEWRSYLDLRSLQSIALYLKMSKDLEKIRVSQLSADIGAFIYKNFQNNPEANEWVQYLAKSAKVNTSVFDFLCSDYSAKLIVSKINRFNVFGKYINEADFMMGHSPRVVLNYHSDVCGKSVEEITNQLHLLMVELKSMAHFKKDVNWFRGKVEEENKEKLIAAVDYFVKYPSPMRLIMKVEDLECYFFDREISEHSKELVSGKIKSLYGNRKNRKLSEKKQCNFTIDVKTINFISSMARDKKMSRSDLLEWIFKSENCHLFKQISKDRLN